MADENISPGEAGNSAPNNTTVNANNTIAASKSHEELVMLDKWQNKVFYFLVGVPSILVIVFIILATLQTNEFNKVINEKKDIDLLSKIIPPVNQTSSLNNYDYTRWATLSYMEQESVNKRYKQAGFLLMSRVLTKYLGFFTGMILAIVGAAFIIGKLSENTTTISGSSGEKINFSLASSSPGIIFGVFGTALMLSTIFQHAEINVQEQPMFLNANTLQVIRNAPANKVPGSIPIESLDPADIVDTTTNKITIQNLNPTDNLDKK